MNKEEKEKEVEKEIEKVERMNGEPLKDEERQFLKKKRMREK
ncbi:MAG: hypothetical protein ACOCQD_01805 [archaeon]